MPPATTTSCGRPESSFCQFLALGNNAAGARWWSVLTGSVARPRVSSNSTRIQTRLPRRSAEPQRIVVADAHGWIHPRLGPDTVELGANPRDIEEPSTPALAVGPPYILLGDDADAWGSERSPPFPAEGLSSWSPVRRTACSGSIPYPTLNRIPRDGLRRPRTRQVPAATWPGGARSPPRGRQVQPRRRLIA